MLNTKLVSIFFIVGIFFVGIIPMAFSEPLTFKTIHQEKSLYRDIAVTLSKDQKCLGFVIKNNVQMEGCEFLKNPDMMVFDFTKLLLAGLYLNPHPHKVLMIGLGIGTVPKALVKLYPDVTVDTVEIDPAIFKLAKEYFNFKETDRSHVFIEDGRMYVKRALREGDEYDMVLLDAFNGDYIPEHMMTKEFFEEVKQILTPSGVFAANTFSSSRLYSDESVTYQAVFGPFYNLKGQAQSNRIIVAQKNGIPSPEKVLANAVLLDNKFEQFGVTQAWLLSRFSTVRDWALDARVLTDQYSPANLLNTNKP